MDWQLLKPTPYQMLQILIGFGVVRSEERTNQGLKIDQTRLQKVTRDAYELCHLAS